MPECHRRESTTGKLSLVEVGRGASPPVECPVKCITRLPVVYSCF